MIRKAVIIPLTLAALGTVVLWLDSYRTRELSCLVSRYGPMEGVDRVPGRRNRDPLGCHGLRLVSPLNDGMMIAWTD